MKVSNNIPSIISDNDITYFKFLQVSIEHSDPECIFSCYRTQEKLIVHITPSQESFRQDIIKDILGVHHILNLKPIFSSSLKISKKISFTVEI